ncbi:MAG: CoA ester lyase [Epsilonproteobacteria bacterium]|nr:CoA ester lyase [Campylobacterota bacterium]NPA65207.1 CoA ester lyase [Campylobacterota bacterium]
MIFDAKMVESIQKAIDEGDREFFLKRLRPRARKVKKGPFSSALMVSAHRAKHLNKLDELEADAAIINLEDGVAPRYKQMALLAAALFIQEAPQKTPFLIVRINPLDQGGDSEITFLNDFYPDAIRVPKVRSLDDLQRASDLLVSPIALHASIETKEAFVDLGKLKHKRVEAFYLGILDLLADLGIPQKVLKIKNPTVDYILSHFLIHSHALGVLPVSFVYQDYEDLEEFEEWCRYEADMGYSAKGCISPKQVQIVNRILKRLDIQRALYIKNRFEQMAAQGITGFEDERYGFIDEPIYKDALNILSNSAH